MQPQRMPSGEQRSSTRPIQLTCGVARTGASSDLATTGPILRSPTRWNGSHALARATSTRASLPSASPRVAQAADSHRRRSAEYTVRLSDPDRRSFRGLRVLSASPPAQRHHLRADAAGTRSFRAPRSESAESYVLLAAPGTRRSPPRLRAAADPDFVEVPVAELTSSAWAEQAAARIRTRAGIRSPQALGEKARRTSRRTTRTAMRSRSHIRSASSRA